MARFFSSNSPVDDLRNTWCIRPAAAVLGSLSITQSLHTISIKKRMGSSAQCSVHQWVCCQQPLISSVTNFEPLHRLGGLVL